MRKLTLITSAVIALVISGCSTVQQARPGDLTFMRKAGNKSAVVYLQEIDGESVLMYQSRKKAAMPARIASNVMPGEFDISYSGDYVVYSAKDGEQEDIYLWWNLSTIDNAGDIAESGEVKDLNITHDVNRSIQPRFMCGDRMIQFKSVVQGRVYSESVRFADVTENGIVNHHTN